VYCPEVLLRRCIGGECESHLTCDDRNVRIAQSDLVAGIDDGVGTNGCRVGQISASYIGASSNTGVKATGGVAEERTEPAGGIRAAGGVAAERIDPAGSV